MSEIRYTRVTAPVTKTEKYNELCRIMPFTNDSERMLLSNIECSPVKVYITTVVGSETIDLCLGRYYIRPHFIPVVVMSEDTDPNYINRLCCEYGVEVILYPKRIAGNLYAIRAWIESIGEPPYVISDDDPGHTRKGKYCFDWSHPTYVDPGHKSGAGRPSADPSYLSWIWNVVFYIGRLNGCDYVGLNSSRTTLSPLPGHETSPNRKSKRGSSFAPYAQIPSNFNVCITGAQGVLNPRRSQINPKLQHIKQEYALSCINSIANGGGTYVFMPVLASFFVKPPKDAEKDINFLREIFSDIVSPGNAARGISNEEKTGSIIKLKTKEARRGIWR